MNNNTIIFVGSPAGKPSLKQVLKNRFFVSPLDIAFRIFVSFVPPFSKKYQKIHVDFLGPALALLILSALLNYGQVHKKHMISFTPVELILSYSLLMPVLCYVLLKLSGTCVNLSEIVALLGYAMYGKIFTIALSLLFYDETSNGFFFFCLMVFSGLSTFRLVLALLFIIPKPAIRLLICSLVAVIQISVLLFLHFVYMHRSFAYGKRLQKL